MTKKARRHIQTGGVALRCVALRCVFETAQEESSRADHEDGLTREERKKKTERPDKSDQRTNSDMIRRARPVDVSEAPLAVTPQNTNLHMSSPMKRGAPRIIISGAFFPSMH